MALGDGDTWDETAPDDDTNVSDVDDHEVHVKKAIRIRLAKEHVWPSSQAASATAGYHKYITFQPMATTSPSTLIAGTTSAAILAKTSGTGYELFG